jgi:hypothetical protein
MDKTCSTAMVTQTEVEADRSLLCVELAAILVVVLAGNCSAVRDFLWESTPSDLLIHARSI